jgi:sucrose phosphorylase
MKERVLPGKSMAHGGHSHAGSWEARLGRIYGAETARRLLPALQALLAAWRGKIAPRAAGWSEKDALLIAYADSIVAADHPPLRVLHDFLKRRVGARFSFVHLLPFYPFSSDDGFSVIDFRAVREDLGAWEDVERLARDCRLVFDGVINHVSAASRYAHGYLTGDPAFAELFIAMDPQADTSSVLRTRNLPLLHDYPAHDGTRWLWTTFSRDQLDLNYRNPAVLLEILDVLLGYAARGASMIRLDAIPYLWKEPGTACAHLPQTHELIKLIHDVLAEAAPHLMLLTETNVPHRENVTYFGNAGDEAQMIYNFALAPLILWSLTTGDAGALTAWAAGVRRVGPTATYLNITATHDGIGMRPTEGILSEPQRNLLVRLAREHGGDVTGKRNPDGSIAPYELNINYFDALNAPDSREPMETQIDRFLLSQAIPMALIGIPGVYIHSLLGSRNDREGVQQTGRARSINRARLQIDTLTRELDSPGSLRARVFARIMSLLEKRSMQPLFHPDAEQDVLDLGPGLFTVRRHDTVTGHALLAVHNMRGVGQTVNLAGLVPCGTARDLLTGERFPAADIPFSPYAFRWLATQRTRRTERRKT